MRIIRFVICTISLLALLAVGYYCCCERERKEYLEKISETESFRRSHTLPVISPRDYSTWGKTYLPTEPDVSTTEGKQLFDEERKRVDVAQKHFRTMLNEELASIYTNRSKNVVGEFSKRVEDLIDAFRFRENRCAIMREVEWKAGAPVLAPDVARMRSDEIASEAIGRFYSISSMLSDWFWTKAGDEYAAAESDMRTLTVLSRCEKLCQAKGWLTSMAKIKECTEAWKRDRCDSPTSNFCRSHEYCEEIYRLHYKDRVERGETNWLKTLRWTYQHHLTIARKVLGREPQWGPERLGEKRTSNSTSMDSCSR